MPKNDPRQIVRDGIENELVVGLEDGAPVNEIADRILERLTATKTRMWVERLLEVEAAGAASYADRVRRFA